MDDKITIRNANELIDHGITWNHQPVFEFATEVDALQTVEVLGEQLRAAREHERQIMRWLEAAIPAAHHNGEGKTQPQAIINHSGVAQQTVYNILGADSARRLNHAVAKAAESFQAIAPHLAKYGDTHAES